MQGSGNRFPIPKLVIGFARLFRGLGDQLDTSLFQGLPCLIGNSHAPIDALTDDQQIGARVEHLFEVSGTQRVTLPAPPIGYDPVRQDDDVLAVRLTVDDDPSESIAVNARRIHDPRDMLPTGQESRWPGWYCTAKSERCQVAGLGGSRDSSR